MTTAWTTRREAESWLNQHIDQNRKLKARTTFHSARERLHEHVDMFNSDLQDLGLWVDGFIIMHRGTISRREIDEELTIRLWMKADGLGKFIFRRGPKDAHFTNVTFIPIDGGSKEGYIAEHARQLRENVNEERAKQWLARFSTSEVESHTQKKRRKTKVYRCGCGETYSSERTLKSHVNRNRGSDGRHYRDD